MEQKYYDTEGNERELSWLVRNEPAWAANIIRHHRGSIDNLTAAVDELVECAEPIYSGNSDDPVEYVVPAEEYQAMFDILVGIKKI